MADQAQRKERLQGKLEEVQIKFLHLLAEIPDRDLERKPGDESWTVKEELVHIVQVIEVIPAGIERASKGGKRSFLGLVPSGVRSWLNGQIIIPQKAKNQTRETIKRAYQDAHKILVSKLEKLHEEDWEKGMPYPRKYRSVEQMAYRPIEHFEEHEAHLRRLLDIEKESV